MKRYLKRPCYESNSIEIIDATESIPIDLDEVSIDDIMNTPDDTYFSCDSIDEYFEFLKKIGLY